MLGALIAFGLYIIFLQKNMQDSWSGTPHLEEVLDNWVIGGTLAITSITTTWTGIVRLVHDRENHKLEEWREFNDILKELPYVKRIMEGNTYD